MSKNDLWDKIAAGTPVNVQTAGALGKGTNYSPAKQFSETNWEAPPSICRPSETHFRNTSFVDLTGLKLGRLVVLGMADDQGNHKAGALWVCRCSCGRYVGRRAKFLKTGNPDYARCEWCANTARLRNLSSGDGARKRAESSEAKKW